MHCLCSIYKKSCLTYKATNLPWGRQTLGTFELCLDQKTKNALFFFNLLFIPVPWNAPNLYVLIESSRKPSRYNRNLIFGSWFFHRTYQTYLALELIDSSWSPTRLDSHFLKTEKWVFCLSLYFHGFAHNRYSTNICWIMITNLRFKKIGPFCHFSYLCYNFYELRSYVFRSPF